MRWNVGEPSRGTRLEALKAPRTPPACDTATGPCEPYTSVAQGPPQGDDFEIDVYPRIVRACTHKSRLFGNRRLPQTTCTDCA
jgi:hypothetical protein